MNRMRIRDTLWPRLNVAPQEEMIQGQERGQGIPRRIHQTFHTKDLPPALRRAVDQTRESNPGWEHRLYDDADIVDFIRTEYGSVILNAYQRIHPLYGAARADLFRYLLMYRVGGVYLDIKSACNRSLGEALLPDDTYLLSKWHGDRFVGMGIHPELQAMGGKEYQQWHIVAAPGHPFLKSVIENVLRNLMVYNSQLHGVGKPGVLRVTGPIAYSLAIHPLLATQSHRIVDSAQDLGFDYSVFMKGQDSSGHKPIFLSHYSDQRGPIVASGVLKRSYGFGARVIRKILRKSGFNL